MHRSYSMRQSRAPTASQVENPPPSPSSTKTGRIFDRKVAHTNFNHSLRRKTAGAFGPDLAKNVMQLVKMEKNVMRSMDLVSKERMDVAQHLSLWGELSDDDVSDVTDKLGVLIYEIGQLEDAFIDRYDQCRLTMKSIRDIECSVQPTRDRKVKLTDQIAHLKYKAKDSPHIIVLEQELVRAEAVALVAEAQLSNITREKLKVAYTYQFDAMREHYEKVATIAGFGKHLLDLIDETPVTPGEPRPNYNGRETSRAIIHDCECALANWVQSNAAVNSSLSVRSQKESRTRDKVIASASHNKGVESGNQDRVSEHRRNDEETSKETKVPTVSKVNSKDRDKRTVTP